MVIQGKGKSGTSLLHKNGIFFLYQTKSAQFIQDIKDIIQLQ